MKKIYYFLIIGILLIPGMIFAQKPVVTVKATNATFNIDGNANETAWAAAPKIAIDKPYTGETVVNGAATFQMLYDADNLYLFVNVIDDVVTLDTDADWKGDKFEFYLGLPGYTPGQKADEAHGRQFVGNASQDWADDATKLSHPWYYSTDFWAGVGARATDGVTFAYNETVDGYAYEFMINKSALEDINLSEIDSLAFDFSLADNDVVGAGLGVRNRLVYYNTGNLEYANENWSAMDLATLKFEKAIVDPKLDGKIIGTSTFYNGAWVPANVFDGNIDTGFDSYPTVDGAWIGLDLGAPSKISAIRFYPRGDMPERMTGGIFQASNTEDFSTGVVDLYTVAAQPPVDWSQVNISNTSKFRYLRYMSPNGSNCNVSEIEFYGIKDFMPVDPKLKGTIIGTSTYYNGEWTPSMVFDGNVNTGFDSYPTVDGAWIGLDLGGPSTISAIRFYPRPDMPNRMTGGIFQASNSADFSADVVTLYNIDAQPPVDWSGISITNDTKFRYVRYLSPDGSDCNVSEIEFYGIGKPIVVAPTLTIKKATSEITIDGNGTDAAWSVVPKTAIDKPYSGETVIGGSATFQMLFDADNLYVFVNVKDDVVTLDTDADWKGDKVEIYFGLPGYLPGQKADEAHGRQFVGNASQDWADDATKLTHPWYYSTDLWPGVGARATDGVTFAYNETVDGYAYEFKINKSAMENVDFATVGSLGFDFTLADNDVIGAGLGVRNRLVYYNTGNLQFNNENWGAMDLATLKFDTKAAPKNLFMVKKTSSTMVMDGVANESAWVDVPKTAIDKPYVGETVPASYGGTFQMLYDTDNLYLFVDVIDATVTFDPTNDWKGDKFEFYLGLPGYTLGQKADEAHGRQFVGNASQNWADDATKLSHPWYYSTDLWPGVGARATDGVTFAYNETIDGYAYEFQINKSALENIDFNTIDSLAFDIYLANVDIPGEGLGVRNRLVYHNNGDLQYGAENWSALDLVGLGFEKTTYSSVIKTTDQNAWISNDILRFKGYDRAVDVEIYSILGQKLLSVKNVNEVNMSHLKGGIYLVKINGGAKAFKIIKQ